MSRHVYKYQIPVADEPTELVMPAGAKVVAVGTQRASSVTLWAESEEAHKPVGLMEARLFLTVPTGADIDSPDATYVGTALDRALVWHVYEIVRDGPDQ